MFYQLTLFTLTLILFICIYMHMNCLKIANIHLFLTCLFPKKQEIHLYEHDTMIKIRKLALV